MKWTSIVCSIFTYAPVSIIYDIICCNLGVRLFREQQLYTKFFSRCKKLNLFIKKNVPTISGFKETSILLSHNKHVMKMRN